MPSQADTPPTTGVVLVVDDEDAVRRSSAQLLTRAGFEVIEAASAAEALALVGADDPPVDAVLSDVVMPQTTGIELAVALRQVAAHIEVVLFSGFTPAALARHRLIDEASPTIIEKPLTRSQLIDALSDAVTRARGKRDAHR